MKLGVICETNEMQNTIVSYRRHLAQFQASIKLNSSKIWIREDSKQKENVTRKN